MTLWKFSILSVENKKSSGLNTKLGEGQAGKSLQKRTKGQRGRRRPQCQRKRERERITMKRAMPSVKGMEYIR